MNNEREQAKKRVIRLFLTCLCIALACFGFVAYMILTKREDGYVNVDVEIYKIIALTGIFFLVLAFGYLLPALFKMRKVKQGVHDPSDIFDETNMRQALEKYIPDGETLLAGVYAVSKETSIKCVFGNCIRTENGLIPSEDGGMVALSKEKFASYDLYLGITQASMIITQCQRNQYFYQFNDKPDIKETDVQDVTSDLLYEDIGTCFLLTDLQSCEMKNGRMGSVNCFLTMKNGSYFKLVIPKHAGLSTSMPHHTEYRETILTRLGKAAHKVS